MSRHEPMDTVRVQCTSISVDSKDVVVRVLVVEDEMRIAAAVRRGLELLLHHRRRPLDGHRMLRERE